MLRARFIPSLLIDENGDCIKTTNFKNRRYIGDILNNVRIFNEKNADELMVFDIDASKKLKVPNFKIIKKISYVCRMPLCYGGGIRSLDDVKKIINYGVEKVCVSSNIKNFKLLEEISKEIGTQSNVVCVNIKKNDDDYCIINPFTKKIFWNSIKVFLDDIDKVGIGEIIFNFVDKDGVMDGFDIFFLKKYLKFIKLPFTILGGGGDITHLRELVKIKPTIGIGCGSYFIYKGVKKAILISYPNLEEKKIIQNF
jgi:imidazole glycerol-phosphate synthase subunit HisF